MIYPPKPTCHGPGPSIVTGKPYAWRSPLVELASVRDGYPRDMPFRTCDFCGSIHPQDLVRYLRAGARLRQADPKYGYIHKYYVEGIPTALPIGERIKIGSTSRPLVPADDEKLLAEQGGTFEQVNMMLRRVHIPAYSTVQAGQTAHAKFYTDHLTDEGYDEEALAEILGALSDHTHYHWERTDDGKIRYRRR